MLLLRLAGIDMSDEAAKTFGGGIRAFLGAGGFLVMMFGGYYLYEAKDAKIGFALIVLGLPIFLSAAAWEWLRKKGRKQMALAIIVLSALGLAVGIFLLASTPKTAASAGSEMGFPKMPSPYFPQVVSGRAFRNERVVLDGFQYDHCIFENVTLVYNGTTPVRLDHNEFKTPPRIASDNPAVTGAIMLLHGLGATRNVNLEDVPPSSHIEPPK